MAIDPERIDQDTAARVEELLARHGRYRPLDLLVALHRLPAAALEQWRAADSDPGSVLEDWIAGNPERWTELLLGARAWAERRGLEADLRVPADSAGKALRAARTPGRQQLLCTEYRRVEQGPQLDLFLDNPGVIARNHLGEALLAGDAQRAAESLAALDPTRTDHAAQTAAEVLVDALDWTPGNESAEAALAFVEQHLEPAANTFLDRRAGLLMRRYWRALADAVAGRTFDSTQPNLHPSWLLGRAGDPAGVVAAVQAEPDWRRHAELCARLFDAAAALGDRGLMLEAIIELCWRNQTVVLQCLNRCVDAAINRAFEQFCEAETELPLALLPAWLALSMPIPEPGAGPNDDDPSGAQPAARAALSAAAALRRNPDDINARLALREPAPALFEHWLKRRAGSARG